MHGFCFNDFLANGFEKYLNQQFKVIINELRTFQTDNKVFDLDIEKLENDFCNLHKNIQ